jgi:hypothetical protein
MRAAAWESSAKAFSAIAAGHRSTGHHSTGHGSLAALAPSARAIMRLDAAAALRHNRRATMRAPAKSCAYDEAATTIADGAGYLASDATRGAVA